MTRYASFKDQVFLFLIGKKGVQIKGPRSKPLFSERNGYVKPFFRTFGWRIFWVNKNAE